MIQKLICSFAKAKKTVKEAIKVHRSEINEDLKGYHIYECKKRISFKIVSSILFLSMLYEGYQYFYSSGRTATNNLILLTIVGASFAIHQKRLVNTAKSIVVDKKGENLLVARYNMFAIGKQTVNEVPIYLLRGFGKANFLGGVAIHGGKIHGFSDFKFYFQKQSILDKTVFNGVVAGRLVKYVNL